MRGLLDTADLTTAEIVAILDEASTYVDASGVVPTTFTHGNGKRVVLAFFEPSTRTRLSFETAAQRLGASVLVFHVSGSSVEKGETLFDTVHTIEAMSFDTLVIRHGENGMVRSIAERTTMSVVNAGEGSLAHPTQALLDAAALRERFDDVKGLRVCIVGDIAHSRVARSQVDVLTRLGVDMSVCAPGSLDATDGVLASLPRYESIDDALSNVDVISLLRIQRERITGTDLPSLDAYRAGYAMTDARMQAHQRVIVIHPGPVNYGVEIDPGVADSDRSLIRRQVTHGVAVRMAVLNNVFKHRTPNT